MLTGTTPRAAGARLRLIRELKGWTGAYLAEVLMGTSRQNLANWEAGRFIPVPWLLKFCMVTGATPDWVLLGDPSGLKGETYTRVMAALGDDQPPTPPKRRRAKNAA